MHVSTLITQYSMGWWFEFTVELKKLGVGYKVFSGLVGIYLGSSCLTSQLLPAPSPLSFNNQHSRGGNYLSGPDIQVILSWVKSPKPFNSHTMEMEADTRFLIPSLSIIATRHIFSLFVPFNLTCVKVKCTKIFYVSWKVHSLSHWDWTK